MRLKSEPSSAIPPVAPAEALRNGAVFMDLPEAGDAISELQQESSASADEVPPQVPVTTIPPPHDPVKDPRLLEFLRKWDNPFDIYVQSQNLQGRFKEQHVPEVNAETQEKLWAVLKRYYAAALGDSPSAKVADMPRSGVAFVTGARGGGKTHLLQAIRLEEKQGFRPLIVAPTAFESSRSFPEYLLQQLVGVLLDGRSESDGGPLQRLARWFTRRVMVQALFAMNDAGWLAHHASSRAMSLLSAVVGHRGSDANGKEDLTRELQKADGDVVKAAASLRQDVKTLRQIARRHILATEPEFAIGDQIRRRLYLELIELNFDPRREEISNFLLDEFTEVKSQTPPSRNDLVREMLSSLVNLFVLGGQPVLFAFDALETLLHDPPEAERCVSFSAGLAEIIDRFMGIPIAVLAENGHFQAIYRHISNYAKQRIEQGVPSVGYGSISRLDLSPVDVRMLESIVRRRMSELLKHYKDETGIADVIATAPLPENEVALLVHPGQETPLRVQLRTIKARYDEIVFGRRAEPISNATQSGTASADGTGATSERSGSSASVNLPKNADLPTPSNGNAKRAAEDELRLSWDRELRQAVGRINRESSYLPMAEQLLDGLKRALRAQIQTKSAVNGWLLEKADSEAVGDHPTYGRVLRCEWRKEAQTVEIKVGLLLSSGRGFPRDLSTKLSAVNASMPESSQLIILWPKSGASEWIEHAAHESLPAATREVWDQCPTTARDHVRLMIMPPPDLASWVFLNQWEATVRDREECANGQFDSFIAPRTHHILERLAPHDA